MRENKWRFLDTGKGSAFFNMALDEAMMRCAERSFSCPVFRVYGWEPPAITLGYSQNVRAIIDYDRCRADGIDVAFRPTGGRAVYHEHEIAYTIVAPIDDPHFGGTVMETYSRISRLLCDALCQLGVPAVFTRGTVEHERQHFADNAPCFMSVSRYEITCDGKKIVGSAQRRLKKVFLQHGSILTGHGQEKIAYYYRNQSDPNRHADAIENRSANLRSIVGKSVSDKAVSEALFNQLVSTVEGEVVHSKPLDEELEFADLLIGQKLAAESKLTKTNA